MMRASSAPGRRHSKLPRRGRVGRARGLLLVLLQVGALLLPWQAAMAQIARDEAVFTRPRPDFDPIGVELFGDPGDPASPFLFYPRLDVTQGWDDNVFRQDNDTRSDNYSQFSPRFILVAEDVDQSYGIDGLLDVRRYWEETKNDYEDYNLGGFASFESVVDLRHDARLSWGRFHENRDDPDAPSGAEDINEFDLGQALLYNDLRLADWLLRLEFDGLYYDYRSNGPINNDDRDRFEYYFRNRLGYEFQPGIFAFVEPEFNWRRYSDTRDDNGFNRDSDGNRVLAGITYDVTGVTFAELSAGYVEQRYDDEELDTAKGFSLAGEVVWNATDTMTVNLGLDRSVQESTLEDVSGVITFTGDVGVDFEIRDDWLLSTDFTYTNQDFEGTRREDNIYQAALGMIYFINEFSSARLKLERGERDSNENDRDYKYHLIEFTLALYY